MKLRKIINYVLIGQILSYIFKVFEIYNDLLFILLIIIVTNIIL